MVSLMQNKGKSDNRKNKIMVSFDEFSAPSENQIFISWPFYQFTTQFFTYASWPWISLNSDVTLFVEPAN